jgi:hypothetical protein
MNTSSPKLKYFGTLLLTTLLAATLGKFVQDGRPTSPKSARNEYRLSRWQTGWDNDPG